MPWLFMEHSIQPHFTRIGVYRNPQCFSSMAIAKRDETRPLFISNLSLQWGRDLAIVAAAFIAVPEE
jgi:hypothetical protein